MKKLWRGYQKHKNAVLILTGLLAVSLIALPYLVLGEGSYVQVHDQLDGEVLNYICQARYLGQEDVIPEFMNGMDKAAMLPPAPLGVLLYRIFPPFAAFAVMHWLCLLVGFLGMFGLGKKLGLAPEVGWITAILFCYIPFYPVYGLAALGQPMLVLGGLRLREGPEAAENKRVFRLSFLGLGLYAAASSLTLVGYAWLGLGLLWALGLLLSALLKAGTERKRRVRAALRVGSGILVLLVVYLLTNLDLLRSLTGEGFTTHRQEMVLQAVQQPLTQLKELLFSGGSYSPVYSAGILTALMLLTLTAGVRKLAGKRESGLVEAGTHPDVCLGKAWRLAALIFCGALLAVLWNWGPVAELRNAIGGAVTYFQADRVYWIFPFAWMLVLGYTLEGVRRLASPGRGRSGAAGKLLAAAAGICGAVLVAAEGLQILRDSTLNKNIRLMLLEDYEQVTWESIYMEDVFARIDETIGEDKDSCSVVSLGIYPSVALYNGYTCSDGYSNNYDLAYKHRFRQIMAAELEENEETRRYFDDWGNRLYLAGAPYGINGMVEKGRSGYMDLDYDLEAMYALNIRYLLAAAPVELNSASLENTSLYLELTEGSPFSSDTSYYEVWVYRLTQ